MDEGKNSLLLGYFNQIEAQVVFGDTKASLFIAGNSVLLAVTGSLMKIVSGCPADGFSLGCLKLSFPLAFATLAAAFIIVALAHALYAARPADVHANPPPEFFLISYVARIGRAEFVESFRTGTKEDLEQWALETIHGKANYAVRKFRLLRRAVDATLLGLASLVCAMFSIIVRLH